MIQKSKTALIVGATGVIGRNLLQHLLKDGTWNIIALSRRKPDILGTYQHLSVDLLNREDSLAKLSGVSAVTHIFYSAYIEGPTWHAMVAPNMAMLTNLMDGVEPHAGRLEHVNLMHGTKWYGNHLGPFKTPASESDPRHFPPNFYYDQQDFITRRQTGKRWTWSSARPHAICGFATGNPMNLVMVVAVYASLSKYLGLPLRHPGSEANARVLFNVTDCDLLSRACVWMSTEEVAANEPYNVTNGDCFRWRDMWPAFADYFGMNVAQQQKIDLMSFMSDKAPVWEELATRYQLQPISFDTLVSWKYGNFVFDSEFDILSATTKVKRRGFTEVQDSLDMFFRHFDELRSNRIIPTF